MRRPAYLARNYRPSGTVATDRRPVRPSPLPSHPMQTLRVALALMALTTPVTAQESGPLEIVKGQYQADVKQIKDSKTYLVPTVTLHLSHHGSISVRNEARGASSAASATFGVEGLDKAIAQGLAAKIEEDLVTKLRAAGFNVLTWNDVKDDPSLTKRGRMTADKDLGLPASKDVQGKLIYMETNPTDEQALATGRGWAPMAYGTVAKARGAVVIWPEIWLDYPQLAANKSAGYRTARASISVAPGMDLRSFMVHVMNPKGAGGAIRAVGPIDVADEVGSLEQISATSTRIASNIGRRRGDYALTLDVAAFSDRVLRAGAAVNDLVVAQALQAHR
jgi:hypothetical protein